MTKSHQHGKLEVFVDDNILDQAEQGNHQAIRDLAGLAAAHIRQMSVRSTTGHNELTDFVAKALDEIAESTTPNDAFRWSRRGKQPQNKAFLEWNLAQYVKNVLSAVGGEVATAIRIVGDAAFMDDEKCGVVEKAYYRWKDSEMPEELFPISATTSQTLKQIEQRLPDLLSKFKQK